MKVEFVHDYFIRVCGAEKVAGERYVMLPESEIIHHRCIAQQDARAS